MGLKMRAAKLSSQRGHDRSNIIPIGDRLEDSAPRYRSADERRAFGRKLRERIPREAHGRWAAPVEREDPIDLLITSNRGRMAQLIPIRHGRMVQSPFAFFRGSAALMAADLAHTPNTGLRVQACGDAHLQNFGGFATPERNVIFDINDFDETFSAPWEWDLKRLAASVVLAGRHVGVGVMLFCTTIAPALRRIDLREQARKLEISLGMDGTKPDMASAWRKYELRAYRLIPGSSIGKSVAVAETLVPEHRLFIHRVRRRQEVIDTVPEMILEEGDVVALSGPRQPIVELIGPRGDEIDDKELLDIPVSSADVLLINPKLAGANLGDVSKQEWTRGIYLRSLRRGDQNIPIGANVSSAETYFESLAPTHSYNPPRQG